MLLHMVFIIATEKKLIHHSTLRAGLPRMGKPFWKHLGTPRSVFHGDYKSHAIGDEEQPAHRLHCTKALALESLAPAGYC